MYAAASVMTFYMIFVLFSIKIADSNILAAGERYHIACSQPFVYDASYYHTRQHGAIPHPSVMHG